MYIYLCRVTRENARLMSHIPGNRKRDMYIYVYMCIYIYIYIYICIYICTYICICAELHMRIRDSCRTYPEIGKESRIWGGYDEYAP